MNWQTEKESVSIMWDNLYVEGAIGSEGGEIIFDEEYRETCRITLEKCESYYAITCGVYGSMMHTAFSDSASCYEKYASMKKELQEFVDRNTTAEEESKFYHEFTSKY